MHATLTSLLESYGYVVLFLLVALESLGIPLPGETALVTAAAFAAAGHLSIYWVVATAAVAAIVGDNGGYWIGREGGLRFVRRYGRMLHIRGTAIERAHAFFERHGATTVFFGRFIALLRAWAAVLAGVSFPSGHALALVVYEPAGLSARGFLDRAGAYAAHHRACCGPSDHRDWCQSAVSRRARLQVRWSQAMPRACCGCRRVSPDLRRCGGSVVQRGHGTKAVESEAAFPEKARPSARPGCWSRIRVGNECVVPLRERLAEGKLHLDDSALSPGAARSAAPAVLSAC